jgi:hypothetical protein
VKFKADAQFWPIKLQNTVQATEDELVADEKKYKEEQAAEQEGFSMHVVAGAYTRSLQSSTLAPSGFIAHVRAQLEHLQALSTG